MEAGREAYVVALGLIPVEGVLGADRAVAGVRIMAAGSVRTTPATSVSTLNTSGGRKERLLARETGLAKGLATNIAGDLALEAVHVH